MAEKTDWERIETEYRAGQFSIREIARLHGVSEGVVRKKAKQFSWERDLTKRVREAVRIKAVRNSVRTEGNERVPTDDEIVEFASERTAHVLVKHQTMLGGGHDITSRLLNRVHKIVEEIEGAEPPKTQTQRMQVMAITARAADLLDVVLRSMSKIIPLERQAYNLDDKGGDDIGQLSREDAEAELARLRAAQGA